MDKLNTDKKILRKYGITMGIILLLIAFFVLMRNKHSALPVLITALVFLVAALAWPVLLKPVYIAWMKLALVLSWVNTRLILIIIFYLIFAPIGLLIRLFGVDLLDRKIEKHKTSYWKKKELEAAFDYGKQF